MDSSIPSASGDHGAGGVGAVTGDSIVLEEEIDQNYVPSEEEVREYAKWLGMELEVDLDLFWIAKEGLKAPLPENWKPCKTVDTDEIYYFNFATGESTWDHPCDEYYRKLYEEEKKKKTTKDKAKHDKSKQQAKKDVSQLLGKDKKKKGRPAGRRPSHHSSPERAQAISSPLSSIFDRKPLPGIGRQLLQSGETGGRQVSGSSPTQFDKTVTLAERSPSRTQASSLVGHRLSQHLAVSIGSEDGDEKPEDQKNGGKKGSPIKVPLRTQEGATMDIVAAAAAGLNAKQEATLREVRKKHARELDEIEQAHSDIKDQLEGEHRRNLELKKRQWAASAEAQCEQAREALKRELQDARVKHSREIGELEKDVIKAEHATEVATIQREKLESALVEVKRQVVEEKQVLQETREAARKVQATAASPPDDDLRRELTRVISELEDERKHVSELEGQLKEAHNGTISNTKLAVEGRPESEENIASKLALLEEKLAQTIRENESLRKKAAVGTAFEVADRISKELVPHPEQTEVTNLRKALEEMESRLSEVQRAKDLSMQDSQNAAAALVEAQEKAARFELDNRRLVDQIARYNVQDKSRGGVYSTSPVEVDKAEPKSKVDSQERLHISTGTRSALVEDGEHVSTNLRGTEELRANMEAARNEAARWVGEAEKFRELEAQVRSELQAVKMELQASELKIADLNGSLATAEHERALGTAAAEELRRENTRLKCDMEAARSIAEGDTTQEIRNTLLNEVRDLRVQVAAISRERDGLNEEIGALKQQLGSSEGAHVAERGIFDTSLASQQRHIGSLQTTIKKLEAELLAGQRREEAIHATAKTLRENVAASKMEAWRLQEKLRDTALEAERAAAEVVRMEQETVRLSNQKSDLEATMVSAADFEKATAETRATTLRLRHAEEEVGRLQNSLHEMTAKLADSQRVAASVQLDSERAVSNMVPKEELAKARRAEREASQRLKEALVRCAEAEESFAQACEDPLSCKTALRDAEQARNTLAKECSLPHPLPVRTKGYRDATSQTSAKNGQLRDLEQTLLLSKGELELARADLVSRNKQIADLQQQLAESAAEVQKAMLEARQNSELASERREEIACASKREQAALRELLVARVSLNDAEKAREHMLFAAKRANLQPADVEIERFREGQDLRVTLTDAAERACTTDVDGTYSELDAEVLQPTATSEEQSASPPKSPVVVKGGSSIPNNAVQLSTSGESEAMSRGLAEELMQKLTDETKQRRSTRQALSDKASRSWTKKLNEEKRMLTLAKEAVRHHKARVKERQQRLLLCQAQWRERRQLSQPSPPSVARPRHSARQSSLEDAKHELDSEVYELNKFVKQLRSSKRWLDERERKLADFETLLGADAPGFGSRLDRSSASSPAPQSPSPEVSSSAKLHSLEAMQQELDNDFSSFSAGSSVWGFSRARPEHGADRKRTRDQRHESKRGKENALPESRPMFPMECPPYSAFSAAPGFWGFPPYAYLGEDPRHRGSVRFGFPALRPHQNAYHRGRRSNAQASIGGIRDFSESELQRWLDRPDHSDTRHEIRSGIAARERKDHFAKLAVEGKQAYSTVALHVDWLNTLREEMGLLGFNSAKFTRLLEATKGSDDRVATPRHQARGVQAAEEV